MENTQTIEKKQFDISGKRRFQKTYGNTYHSCKISQLVDGQWVDLVYLPRQYGYGDQYIQTGIQWLKDNGHIEVFTYENGFNKPIDKNKYNVSCRVLDVDRQKDL